MAKRAVGATIGSVKALLSEDDDFVRDAVRVYLQDVLAEETTTALGAGKGERSAGRLGYRSGYYDRALVTRVGRIALRVPQDRDGRFSTDLFERYQRSEKALVSALTEMSIQGVSTRKVKTITEALCGYRLSAATISNIVKRLDDPLQAFAGRRLEERFPYLIVDARYREGGRKRGDRLPGGVGCARHRPGRPPPGVGAGCRRFGRPIGKARRRGRISCWGSRPAGRAPSGSWFPTTTRAWRE